MTNIPKTNLSIDVTIPTRGTLEKMTIYSAEIVNNNVTVFDNRSSGEAQKMKPATQVVRRIGNPKRMRIPLLFRRKLIVT